MPEHVASAVRMQAAGTQPKIIEEYVGRVVSGAEAVSVAHMRSPCRVRT